MDFLIKLNTQSQSTGFLKTDRKITLDLNYPLLQGTVSILAKNLDLTPLF